MSLNLRLPNVVHIVGVGGVGAWIAMFLALAGVKRLILWDMDEVSDHNLNRLPLDPGTIGENKAIAMQRMLARLVPTCEVVALYRWTADAAADIGQAGHDLAYIVACTDTWRSRVEIHEFATAHDLIYIEGSAEGDWGGCTSEPATFVTPEEEHPGYASVPVWVGPCVASAQMVCSYILHGQLPGHDSLRLGWNAEHNCIEAQNFPAITPVPQEVTRQAEIA